MKTQRKQGERLLLNREFLESIKKKNSRESSLLNVVAHRKDLDVIVEQINRMFEVMPLNAKKNKDFLRRICHIKQSTFSGAFAEMVTNYVLRHFSLESAYCPRLGSLTPDFYAFNSKRSFIVEAVCLNQTEDESKLDSLYHSLQRELSQVRSSLRISIRGTPSPDHRGSFKGLAKALKRYLNVSLKGDDGRHMVESDTKARIYFEVFDAGIEGPVLNGWSRMGSGDSYIKKITEALTDKTKKYRFPFVLSCVLDFKSRIHEQSILNALIGTPQLLVPISNDGNRSLPINSNTNDGFWGIRNRSFERNHLIQNLLFTRLIYDEKGIKLRIFQMQNPHFRSGFDEIFAGVPDLLSQPSGDDLRNACDLYDLVP